MPKITIDQREIEVPPGATVLEAVRRLGVDIPTLCYLEGCRPSTSCLVCMVKIAGGNRLVPACGTVAVDGMVVESETAEVYQVRRSALELLLSDHLGDCLAPCYFGCPAHIDIPQMLRQIAAGELREALVTVKNDIALPAVLGRICPAPCEKACRRNVADGAVAICSLKRLVADVDLASGEPYLPPCQPATGRRVAIVGAGPTGLSAAYYLTRQGHACTLLDENDKPGGRLWRETTDEQLPRDVLDAEIAAVTRLGVELRLQTRVGPDSGDCPDFRATTQSVGPKMGLSPSLDTALDKLREQYDAVLIACGATARQQAESWGLTVTSRGIQVTSGTFEAGAASGPSVFAAGGAVRGKALVVRSVADGKEAAAAIGRYLAGGPVVDPAEAFSTRIGRMEADEMRPLLDLSSSSPRRDPAGGISAGFTPSEGAEQAARCLRCDCRGLHSCKLRKYAALYGARPRRYKAQRRTFQQDAQHAAVIFEPGKCIDCGLCIQIAAAAGEPLGLTFIGRGFDVRVGAPLNQSLADALRKVAAQCVAACPTAALAWKDKLR